MTQECNQKILAKQREAVGQMVKQEVHERLEGPKIPYPDADNAEEQRAVMEKLIDVIVHGVESEYFDDKLGQKVHQGDQEACPICLQRMVEGETCIRYVCRHALHKHCHETYAENVQVRNLLWQRQSLEYRRSDSRPEPIQMCPCCRGGTRIMAEWQACPSKVLVLVSVMVGIIT